MNSLTFIDLFAGIGNFSRGLEWAGMRCVAQIECDEFCNHWREFCWKDIQHERNIYDYHPKRFSASVVCGGPPCQPASRLGKRRGTADSRWLWPETVRIVDAASPLYFIFENPVDILNLQGGTAFEHVLLSLEALQYEVWPIVLPACAVEAPHERERLWLVGNATGERLQASIKEFKKQLGSQPRSASQTLAVADANRSRRQRQRWFLPKDEIAPRRFNSGDSRTARPRRECWRGLEPVTMLDGHARLVKPGVRCLANGHPQRNAFLRAIGNSVVPQVAEEIGRAVIELHNSNMEALI